MPQTVRMVPESGGAPVDVPVEDVQIFADRGFTVQSNEARAAQVVEGAREDYYSSPEQVSKAVLAAGARGFTGGASDVAVGLVGGDDARRDLAALREYNQTLSAGAELAGNLVGIGKIAGRVGARVAGTGGGALAELGRAGVAAGTEGAIMGAGQGVTELALSDDPLTVERIASVMKSNVVLGGATGGGIGVIGKGVGLGLRRAKTALDGITKKGVGTAADVGDDLARLDAKGLRAARETELDALHAKQLTDRTTARSAAVDDVLTYRQQVDDANPWLVIDEGTHAAQLNKAKRSLRAALDDPKGLRENPGSLLKPLRVEEQALEGALAKREEIAKRLANANKKIAKDLGEEIATLPDKATHVELSGKAARRYASFADVKVGKDATVRVAREDAQNFLGALQRGEVSGASQKSFDALGGLLEQNRALQMKIKNATSPLAARGDMTSERLTQIAGAQDALTMGGAKASPTLGGVIGDSALGYAVGAAAGIPVLGTVVMAARAGAGVLKKLGADQAAIAARGSQAITSLLNVGAKVARPAPVLATKVLGEVRYASQQEEKRSKKAKKQQPSLAESFKKRSEEIRSQVAPTPDGKVAMRPDVRAQVADRLAPLRAMNPVLADRIETMQARKVEFLASKLPRRPDVMAMQVGPDRWQPGDMEMRAFARYVAAVEDPTGVVERLAGGSITPEDVEAMKAVYPEMHADIVRQIIEQLPTLQRSLPYQRRLAMSIFSGVPVDPVLDPRVLSVLQASFAAEEGSAGGTMAPRAQPQFGSVSKEKPTPAQERGA